MLIKLKDPQRVAEIRAFFEARQDCLVEQIGETELEVSLLGSFSAEAQRRELERLMKAIPASEQGRVDPDPGRSLAGELADLIRRRRLRIVRGGERHRDAE
jgi:hypothetical protein